MKDMSKVPLGHLERGASVQRHDETAPHCVSGYLVGLHVHIWGGGKQDT